MNQSKLEVFFPRASATVQNVLENTVLWNGFSIQEILIEFDPSFFAFEFIEYLPILSEELSLYF